MDMGECSACLNGTFGRVTTFGIIVFTVVPVVLLVLLALYYLKVRAGKHLVNLQYPCISAKAS